ncbi:MAG TPA: PLD nuclease N-terminal domain-containing protein [Thermoanaerobaculia bacterium]|nr:PLD nuclease N-terminal domain-containing protein [Thermoanaerobaculia bacterium]
MPLSLAFVFGRVYGCASLLVLALDVYSIVQIAESGRSTARKVIWILLVIFFPLGGAILWLLFGKK